MAMDENDLIRYYLKMGSTPSKYNLMQRLDPDQMGNIEDRRGWSPMRTNAATVWDTNLNEIGNLFKHGLDTSPAKWPMPSNAGDKLSAQAGFYDIDNLKKFSDRLPQGY